MQNVLVFLIAAGSAAVALAGSIDAARAYDRWPVIPGEARSGPPRAVLIPFRCTHRPVNNFYDGAYYNGEPPAIYLGFAYRPHYRYSAYRVLPRTYACSED